MLNEWMNEWKIQKWNHLTVSCLMASTALWCSDSSDWSNRRSFLISDIGNSVNFDVNWSPFFFFFGHSERSNSINRNSGAWLAVVLFLAWNFYWEAKTTFSWPTSPMQQPASRSDPIQPIHSWQNREKLAFPLFYFFASNCKFNDI